MRIIMRVLVSELFISVDVVSIGLVMNEQVLNFQIDQRSYFFDVLIIQFHLMPVSLNCCSVLRETD